MMSEFEAAKVVLTHPEFRAALAKRGVTDPEKVFCSPITAGYFAIPEHAGKRIIKVGCYDLRRTTTNMWGWPIERLYAVVDLRERKVLSVADAGVVPIADREQNFTEAAAGTLRAARKPTVMAQPQGANVTINGNEISWGNWRFHARVDGRVGTVISVARWQDGDTLRSVLYQGYVSEMFVPYMDADYGWYSRTYFDTGEYGAGTMATPLKAWRSIARRRPRFCRRRSATTRASRSRRRTRSAFSSEAPAIRSGGTPSPSIRRTKAAPTSSSSCGWPPRSATTTISSTGCSTMQPRSRCVSAQRASTR